MEEEITYPRYDDVGNLLEGPPVVHTEEEEVVEEDGGILNATQTSQSSVAQTILFPQTMQMQREIFVLKGDYITPQDAESFFEQSQRLPRLRINECMQRQAIDLLHVKIMTDLLDDSQAVDRRPQEDDASDTGDDDVPEDQQGPVESEPCA